MRTRTRHRDPGPAGRLLAALLALALLLPAAAAADSDRRTRESRSERHDDETPQQRAIRLRERGDILPLAEVIRINGLDRVGRIIEVDLEVEDGRQVYELKILTGDSVVREYYIDPRDGRILEVE